MTAKAMVTPDSMPKTSPQPKSRKDWGSLVMGIPWVTMRDSPRYMKEVARVMIKALIRVTWIRRPLTAPMAAPAARATRMPAQAGAPAWRAEAMQMALKERMDPVERSMAPEAMTHIMPQARISR